MSDHYQKQFDGENVTYFLLALFKKNSNARSKLQIIKCITLCKIPEVNWLKLVTSYEALGYTTWFFFPSQTCYKLYRRSKIDLRFKNLTGLDSTRYHQNLIVVFFSVLVVQGGKQWLHQHNENAMEWFSGVIVTQIPLR